MTDQVTVVTAFDHPARGTVHCPAAPLLAAWLEALGIPHATGPVVPRGENLTDRPLDVHGQPG
ncbi:hypothetical protein ACWEPF_34265, partial [Kitasatospora sp. NPDC004289]